MEVLQYRCGSTEIDKQVEEAAKLGLANVHQLLQILSEQDQQQQAGISSPPHHHRDQQTVLRPEGSAAASSAIANFRKVSSLLSRTGHARFRRGPRGQTSSLAGLEYAFIECPNTFRSEPQQQHPHQSGASSSSAAGYELATLPPPPQLHQQHQQQQHHHIRHQTALAAAIYRKVEAAAAQQRQRLQQHQKLEAELALAKQLGLESSVTSRSFMSSLSIEASDHKGIYGLPPLQTSSSPLRRKCTGKHDELGVKCASLKCHCSKRRKLRLKRTIQVPAISNKLADIPPDDYSWRKYGQKPIKGSPHPRGYYKCSSMRGCPARKHVERSLEDPTMLIVTYEGEHNHTRSNNNSTTATTNNNSNNNSPGGGGGGGGGGGASPAPPVGGLVAHS